jgi:hypothetical protein
MLKIKDNVDLKELEKYGFEEKEYWYETDATKNSIEFKDCDITIDKKTRKIYMEVYEAYEDELGLYCFDYLYDLIKADLVEKVGE